MNGGYNLIDFSTAILSYRSVGNVFLNENISIYIDEMYSRFNVEVKKYALPDGDERIAYFLDSTMTIATKSDGIIFSVGCNNKYKGGYKKIIYPGDTIGKIINFTERQRIFNGSLIIDNDFGISFILPAPYDEIADNLNDLPLGLEFKEIYVSDYSSWNTVG
ncbi:hypothetical protein [Kalamiella sp. sgz302252]|uniref:hypothetical protein n=1 Tax=Pantoea sp. sgz302252 TaxID=3341827 RepID=UPI0036D3CE56